MATPSPCRSESQPILARTTFKTSREMDFLTEKELVKQTGHDVAEWPQVILKETIDNALDAGATSIVVEADETGIAVRDNGSGLPEETLKAQLDFGVRASSNDGYVSPSRGQQGYGFKNLLPMPMILDKVRGKLIVTAHGKRHVITCGLDAISQRAAIYDDVTLVTENKSSQSAKPETSVFTIGTEIRIQWSKRLDSDGEVVWPFDDGWAAKHFADGCRAMVEGFAMFNPHASFALDWFGARTSWEATDPSWRYWTKDKPTSAHWYEQQHLERLIGAYVTAGQDMLVSELLEQFDGLSGTRKQTTVLNDAGLKRAKLADLIVNNRFDAPAIARLLAAMKQHTKPVRSERLGTIGEEHLRARFLELGIKPESFRYSRKFAKSKNLNPEEKQKASFMPWVLESAFGMFEDDTRCRSIYSGANWSAAVKNPFRAFGNTGEGLETALSDMRATRDEPVVFFLHLAHPRVEYLDRGKSALVIGGAA